MADETHRNDRRARRQYPQEFQIEAVRLADSIDVNAAAERLGVPRATMSNWVRRRRKAAYSAPSSVARKRAARRRNGQQASWKPRMSACVAS